MEAVRFFLVAVAGLILDFAVAWSAAHFLNLPLWFAAGLGFLVAAGVNYVFHELWTFRNATRQLSSARALRYTLALFAVLVTRIATVAALSAVVGTDWPLPILIVGAGVSFVVNYLISKYFIFRSELPESAQ